MASNNNSNNENISSNFHLLNWVLKSSSVFHFVEGYKYVAKIGNSAHSTVLNIMKYTDSGSIRGNWMLRFDNAHPGTNFPHLNMRHKFTGINDPHIKLPPGSLTVAKYGGYASKFLNSLRNLSFACDAYRVGAAVYKDCCVSEVGAFKYTAICLTGIAFEWGGGLVGSTIGAGLGGVLLPGVGSLCGALVGAPAGVFYGAILACRAIKRMQDAKMICQ